MIGLVMICWNDQENMDKYLPSVQPLLSEKTIITTDWGENTTGKLNHALRVAARKPSKWLLKLDADMSVEFHPDLLGFLAADENSDVDAWQVDHEEGGIHWRLPVLLRNIGGWEYKDDIHEWLDLQGRKARPLLRLTVHHHATGTNRVGRYERILSKLNGHTDERSQFYRAEAYRCMGKIPEAIEAYNQRAKMGGWDEEVWYSKYQAAKLANDIIGLLHVYAERPYRHEPLTAAARIARTLTNPDVLFLEE